MALAPDEQTGFSMTLLRLLAFEPAAGSSADAKPPVRAVPREAASTSGPTTSRAPLPASDLLAEARVAPAPAQSSAAALAPLQIADWPAFVAGLKLSGIALQLAAQTELKAIAGNEIVLAVPEAARHLIDKAYTDKLKAALDEALGRRVRLRFDVDAVAGATLAAQEKRERAEVKAKTEAAFRDDPFVQDVLSRFDATIKTESIKPNS
jgi:DNA polymerase-3 subunit gamma/tau